MTALPTEEIDFLYIASNRLTSAVTPQEQLNAVSDFARLTGAIAGQLFYIEDHGSALPDAMLVAAEWTRDGVPLLGEGTAWSFLHTQFAQRHLLTTPAHTVLVADTIADHRIDPEMSGMLDALNIRALVTLPMNSKGRWIGLISFVWDRPKNFNRRDERVYQALLQQVAPVVDSVRLLSQIRDRFHAEQEARRELEMLYTASAAINAASTLHEILSAIAALDINSYAVGISIYEHYDYRRSSGMDLYGMDRKSPRLTHEHVTFSELPLAARVQPTTINVIPDVAGMDQLDATSKAFCAKHNVSALLTVPMMVGERCLGALYLFDRVPQEFSAQDRRITIALGRLVSAALDRLHLQQESESARQRAELLARVTAALSKATDEDAIMSAVAQYTQTTGAETLIMLYGDVYDVNKTNRTIPIGYWRDGRVLPSQLAFPDREDRPEFLFDIWQDQQYPLAFVEDILTDPRIGDDENRRLFWLAYRGRAMAAMILSHGANIRGIFAVFWSRPHHFTAEEHAMLTQILQTLSAVVASRRSYLAERERASQLEAVAEVSAVTTGILKEDDLLSSVEILTSQRFPDFHTEVFLLNPEGDHLVQRTNLHAASGEGLVISMNKQDSLAARAMRTREVYIVPDIEVQDEYDLIPMTPGARAEMIVPLIASNTLLGILCIQSTEINRFGESDKWVMETLADLIAVAIQNARLYAQAQEVASYQERNRLARELHDSVSQALYGISLGAQTARMLLDIDPSRLHEPLNYVLSLAEAGLTEMRALIFDLRPDSLEQEGLIAALVKQTSSLKARHQIEVTTKLCAEPDLPIETKNALYWIVREALHNTMKHAQATQVTLSVEKSASELHILVSDNGIGFDPSQSFPGHLGLRSMRERAARLNGSVDFHSVVSEGTTIRVAVPYDKEA